MRPKIFWNVHPGLTGPEIDELLRQWVEWKPPAVLVMNDTELARVMKAQRPDAMVIYRHWPDNTIEDMDEPEKFLQKMIGLVQDSGIILYAGNELAPNPETAKWLETLIPLADRAGWSLVVGNFATGNPNPTEIEQNLLGVLELISEANNPQYLGLHEYFDFLNPRADGWNPEDGDRWLIGRYEMFNLACDAHGITLPKILITEHGADSLQKQYAGWRRGLTEAQYAQHLLWCDLVYRNSNVLASLVFSYGNSGGWDFFDVTGSETLFKAIGKEYEMSNLPNPADFDHLAELRLILEGVGDYRVNLRAEPNPFAQVLGLLVKGQRVFVSEELSGSYYHVLTEGGIEGYVHRSVAAFDVVGPAVPEEPNPEIPDLTVQSLLNILQTYKEVMEQISALAAHAADLTQEFIEDNEN